MKSKQVQGKPTSRETTCGGWLVWLALACLAGCTTVQPIKEYAGEAPRPDRVLVHDLAVTPGEVELDTGIASPIQQAARGTPRSFHERQVGQQVADAFSEYLVKELRDMGLPAQRANGPAPAHGHSAMVKGAFVSIDEGNRTERMVIGLAAGRSDVRAHVVVLETTTRAPLVLGEFEVDAKSGLKPGMAETMGAGAAAGHIVASAAISAVGSVASEEFGANVEADAQRAAKGLAGQLQPFFASKGWIASPPAE